MGHHFVRLEVLILLLCVSRTVLCLNCYVCNSAKDEACAINPPPDKYLVECSHDTLEILNDFHKETMLEEASPVTQNASDITPVMATAPTQHPEILLNDTDTTSPSVHESALAPESREGHARSLRSPTDEVGKPPYVAAIKLPKDATYCRKTSYHIPAQHNGEQSILPATVRVIRSCGWIPENEKKEGTPAASCKWVGTDGVQFDQCVCLGDGCNTAGSLSSLKTLTFVVSVLIIARNFYSF